MKPLIYLILTIIPGYTGLSQSLNRGKINEGDIIFQDLDCGSMCEAIEKVTKGWNGRSFSHIGLAVKNGDSLVVIESIGTSVCLTSLGSFLNRSKNRSGNSKVVVGRLKPKYRKLIPNAILFAKQQIGVGYDGDFIYNNGKYYCSELIYDAFKYANSGKPFFKLSPMTFNDPETGKPFQLWIDYFENRKTSIPEGAPGCNPGQLSLSKKIFIIQSFYQPDEM